VLEVKNLQIRIGARVLMDDVSFRVDKGDKVGLVGRNGAGKTTLTRVIAGDLPANEGSLHLQGEMGYLPQDPRAGDPTESARTRILNARGIGSLMADMDSAALAMGDADTAVAEAAMAKYGRLNDRFLSLGGYQAEAEAAAIASHLNLPSSILEQSLGTLSGGQRRRIELARILFQNAPLMVLDEPTNHLDADSVTWLRSFLASYPGGVIVISHDVALVEETVNRVFYLDATRATIDIYNMSWKHYLRQREADQERRVRERSITEKKATALQLQAARFGAKASKASSSQQMKARAEKMLQGLEGVRATDKVAKLRFPDPAACGKGFQSGHHWPQWCREDNVAEDSCRC